MNIIALSANKKVIWYILYHWECKFSHGLSEIIQIIPRSSYYVKLKNLDIITIIILFLQSYTKLLLIRSTTSSLYGRCVGWSVGLSFNFLKWLEDTLQCSSPFNQHFPYAHNYFYLDFGWWHSNNLTSRFFIYTIIIFFTIHNIRNKNQNALQLMYN